MAKNTLVFDRIQAFRTAWRSLAPDETFADMTLADFELKVQPSLDRRDELEALEKQVEAKRAERDMANKASRDVLELVVNAVRGTPAHGSDSPLYRALGYVRKSERRSGLTRRNPAPAGEESTGGADAA